MKIVLFGATGMVGQGVLHECLRDPEVELVLTVGRTATGVTHERVRELVHKDALDYGPVATELAGFDACFFCLGISSVGMDEAAYTKITYDYTMAAAKVLLEKNPSMTFVYVSGAGTDASEKGRTMWARVKGRTENAILGMGFERAFAFRPGYIQPLRGIQSKTFLYRAIYAVMRPFYPFWRWATPGFVTTSDEIGRAMLAVAKRGYEKNVVETRDIHALTS